VFRLVAATRLQEMFTALALAIVVGVTLLMESVGLSPALGAFLARVVLADSEFRHEIESDIEPFRGLLLGLFFVSVGATIDFHLLTRAPVQTFALVLALIAVKGLVIFALARCFRRNLPDAAAIGLSLAQGGEFAFVLSAFATSEGVLPADIAAKLNAVVAISMAATPLLFIASDRLSRRLMAQPEARAEEEILSDEPQVIIAGYGRVGQTIGRLMEANDVRVSVLEHDAEQVDTLRGFGAR
jgi:glutathione-regulated potassium-efflux system ancillary protein KefC/glutathione-regulated potassium-efflux system protein KefB